MSTSHTYLIVDNSFHKLVDNEKAINDVSFFAYNYLINPLTFIKTNKVSLLNFTSQAANDPEFESIPLTWETLTGFIADISITNNREEQEQEHKHEIETKDLLEIVYDALLSASSFSKKAKECNVLLISAFRDSYNWNAYFNKIAFILKNNNNVNLICIDTFESSHEIHDRNLEILNSSLLSINESNEINMMYTLDEAKNTLTSASSLVPKFKRPIEIYSYTLSILGIENLEFNISAYPFTKKTSLTDYLTSKMINPKTQNSISQKYEWYYNSRTSPESPDQENGDSIKDENSSEIEIKNPSLIVDGYKFGTTNLLITDLPANEIMLDSIKSMAITGFFPKNSVPPWYLKNDSLIILPHSKTTKNKGLQDEFTDKDFIMYSELWYSMVRQKVFAMVRFVKKNGQDVKYGILYPQGYVDKESEQKKEIEFGAFIFVETIFQDDEKLANFPNLINWKVKDPGVEKEIDDLVDSFCLDEDDLDANGQVPVDATLDSVGNTQTEDLAVEAHVIAMNDTPSDIFSKLREEIAREEVSGNKDGELEKGILQGTPTWKLRQYNNPLLAFERLVYLSSYFPLLQQIKEGEEVSTSLYEIYEKHLPAYVFEAWQKKAEGGDIFRPSLKRLKKQ